MGFLRSKSKGSISARAQLGTFHDSKLLSESRYHGSTTSLHSVFQLRVTPENGEPEFKSELSAWGGNADRLQPGRWTYVLYDADRPDRCDIDKDRLTKEFGTLYNGDQRLLVPKEVSGGWFNNAAPADTPVPPKSASESDSTVGDL